MSPYRTPVAGGRVGVGLPADLQIAKNLETNFSAVVGGSFSRPPVVIE